jgi:hypothetical protein
LPQEPEWLDFNHLWVTGVPAHYLSILAGYLLALWLWRRNYPEPLPERAETGTFALYALVTAAIILAIDGVVTQLLLLRDFPGITFFVQHLLIGFVFVAAWTAYAGVGGASWIVGSLMLALVWVTYNMYLGPRGLPLEQPYYSGYADLWWKSFPGAFVSALLGWWISGWLFKNRRFVTGAATAATLLLVISAAPDNVLAQSKPQQRPDANALAASASASGEAMRVTGPDPTNMSSIKPVKGSISVQTWEGGNRWSHVQNTDAMAVKAEFTSGEDRYSVTIDKAMPRHPLGKYTTWNGVVYDHEMHGDTGIGTGKLPKMRPEIALWGWAQVTRNDELLAPMAPAHVMVTSAGPMAGVMLEIETEDKNLKAEPDGYINVMWHKIDKLQMPTRPWWTRTIIGWAALIGIVVLFGELARREPQTHTRRT